MTDISLTVRRLAKHPASVIASVAALACAIGAAAVTWASLDAVLLNPLPVADPERLFIAGTSEPNGPFQRGSLYPRLQRVRESGAFERTAAEWSSPLVIPGRIHGVETTVRAGFATHDYFETLGVSPARGRAFREDEDTRGASPVAVLTHRYWRERFDADPDVVGRTLELTGRKVPIIGVLPPRFRGLTLAESTDIYLPFHTIADVTPDPANFFADRVPGYTPIAGTVIIGRIAGGRSREDAVTRLQHAEYQASSARPSPVTLENVANAAIPATARAGMDNFARLLLTTVGLLLLIGCTTVGLLLLLRTDARANEFALCLALGATRGRLLGSLMIEALLLTAVGAMLSVMVARWLIDLLAGFTLPGNVSMAALELALDRRLVAVTVLAGFVAALVVAMLGSLVVFRADLVEALRASQSVTPPVRRGARGLLLGLQSAVALALLAGAALLARSLLTALSLNTAIAMDHLVSTTINLRPHGYTVERAAVFFADLRARLATDTRFADVALSSSEGVMTPHGQIVVNGAARQFPSNVSTISVDSRYFATMGIQLIEGRSFATEDRMGGPLVALVSQSYGRLLADGGSPLGTRIQATSGRAGQPLAEYRVIGTVADVVTNVSVLQPLVMYLPAAQVEPGPQRTLTIRAHDPAHAQQAIIAAAAALDRRVIPPPPLTLEQRITRQMGSQRFGATVLGTLGGIALLLTLLGTYVLSESMAATRLREMGIRSALGATRIHIAGVLLAETIRLVGVGILGGLLLAWLGASTIRSFLFGVEATDPLTFGGLAFAILGLALAVSLRAAIRVARVDVAQVLRQ